MYKQFIIIYKTIIVWVVPYYHSKSFPPKVNNSKEKYEFYDQIYLLFSLNIQMLNISVYLCVFNKQKITNKIKLDSNFLTIVNNNYNLNYVYKSATSQ